MERCKVDLAALAVVSDPGPLPPELQGTLSDADLADLSWTDEALGFHGFGYWPVEREAPAYDPATQRLSGEVARHLAAGRCVVVEVPLAVGMTEAELQAGVERVAAEAVARINAEAGEQRARHITVTTGQEGTYTAKQAEAERYAAGGAAPFPYLEAEAAATGSTVDDVAALVLATAKAWTALNAGIEGARRGALVAVERAVAAGEVAAVAAVFPVAWPAG